MTCRSKNVRVGDRFRVVGGCAMPIGSVWTVTGRCDLCGDCGYWNLVQDGTTRRFKDRLPAPYFERVS